MLLSLADLITMATFLSITPSIKDAFNSASVRGEKKGTVFSSPHSAVPLSGTPRINTTMTKRSQDSICT